MGQYVCFTLETSSIYILLQGREPLLILCCPTNRLSLSHAPASELECCCGSITGVRKGAFFLVPDEKFVEKQLDWAAG
jgi:hypothetical protein